MTTTTAPARTANGRIAELPPISAAGRFIYQGSLEQHRGARVFAVGQCECDPCWAVRATDPRLELERHDASGYHVLHHVRASSVSPMAE